MIFVRAFIIGGLICVIAQLLIDYTQFTPARILVSFVTAGVILQALGLYQKVVDIGGAGATVPLPGFGYALANGVIKAVKKDGLLGAMTGGITGTAAGLTAAIFFGYIIAMIFNPKAKK